MTDTKDSSSLPLLLSITGAVLAVAIGGWFLLNKESSVPTTNVATSAEDVPQEQTAIPAESPIEADAPAVTREESSPGVDAELRKARLAADADILIFPPTRSALYYYGRVLQADPEHAVANAELDTMLAKLGRTVSEHLVAEEFDDAHEIATLVAKLRPEHALVIETQRTLDEYTEQLVAEAIQHSQDGDDARAVEVLAAAESLPGRNPAYFAAIRESIGDIRDVRQAAEQDRAQRARLADNDARAAWTDRIRQAITSGNLISPAGASARDLLAENNSWAAERAQMTGEVFSAMLAAALSHIDGKQLGEAEALVNSALELGGDSDALEEVRAALENAFIVAESNRVASMNELVRVKTAQPRYPRRAQQRDLTGWVDVYFTVTASGETADISVNRAEPESVFDRAAIEAVEKWAFEPVEYRGQVINQRAGAKLVFLLE